MEDVEREPLEKGEETDWRPGLRLTTSHPSWMWKNNRKELASREGRNKAGKNRGDGTPHKIDLLAEQWNSPARMRSIGAAKQQPLAKG